MESESLLLKANHREADAIACLRGMIISRELDYANTCCC
jgi:hypothetical protein